MQSELRLPAADGTAIFVRSFLPEGAPRAVVQISHGMAEHSARYARFASFLNEHGFGAYANDHRGHGQTVSDARELGHFADEQGWEKVVTDQLALLAEIRSRHPGIPVFLMGHSMGSYIARSAATRCGNELAGLVLSGTSHDYAGLYKTFRLVAAAERARLGKRGHSRLLRKLSFESFNKQIENPRTDCDWLSRDAAEVDKYVADSLCGFECTTQLWWDLFGGLAEIYGAESIGKLPKQLPVYILAGERDPLNNRLAAIRKLQAALESAQVADVTVRLYQGARHELLNETNRDEVMRDLLHWLEERTARTT
jgi:alpha-beta hydrolase superfamily lysophospholipase